MAASNEALRDHGISEVIKSDRELNSKREGVDWEIKHGHDQTTETKASFNDQAESSTAENTSDDSKVEKQKKQLSLDSIDLNNPDHVIHLLETVELNEEDTDVLLQEAYHMNKKLKEILRRQEADDLSEKSKSKSKRKSSAKDQKPSESGSRQGSAFSVKKPLPPISQDREVTSVYTVKLRRSQTNISDHRHTQLATRSKSSKPGPSQNGSGTNPRRTKQTDVTQRPEWDNRFNYS